MCVLELLTTQKDFFKIQETAVGGGRTRKTFGIRGIPVFRERTPPKGCFLKTYNFHFIF